MATFILVEMTYINVAHIVTIGYDRSNDCTIIKLSNDEFIRTMQPRAEIIALITGQPQE
jgi:hypothetical protein